MKPHALLFGVFLMVAAQANAADRIFGLLPPDQAAARR